MAAASPPDVTYTSTARSCPYATLSGTGSLKSDSPFRTVTAARPWKVTRRWVPATRSAAPDATARAPGEAPRAGAPARGAAPPRRAPRARAARPDRDVRFAERVGQPQPQRRPADRGMNQHPQRLRREGRPGLPLRTGRPGAGPP